MRAVPVKDAVIILALVVAFVLAYQQGVFGEVFAAYGYEEVLK